MLNSPIKKTFALIDSSKSSAKENMRIDKELFDGFNPAQLPILRVYTWETSYTYGISQKLADIQALEHLKTYKHNHAQRLTGGGILFHGNDISYSLLIPSSYVKNLSVKESYELICAFLMTFYTKLGLSAQYAKDVEELALCQSAYCQEGFEAYDIIIDGKKIGGNAQRRAKDVIFQHGSIGLDNTTYSLGHSLEDLGIQIDVKEAKYLLIKAFEETFNVVYENYSQDLNYAS